MRKNLILGKGLVGSHLAELLLKNGEEVGVLSQSEGHDLKNAEKYLDQFELADRVWFIAWEIGAWKKENPAEYEIDILDANLQLCRSVFRVLQKTKKPFLFTSSQAAPSSEATTLGATKRVGEMWTRLLGGHVARFWNVYGWEPVGEKSHLIPDLVWKGMNGKIELMTNGEEERQFLYVKDCAEALFHQFEIGQKHADVTTGEWVSVKKVAELIGEKLNAEVVLGSKPGRPPMYLPETPLESWKPAYTLEKGIEEIIDLAKTWSEKTR